MNTLDLAYKVLTEEPTSNVCALNAAKTGLIDYIASSYMAEDEKEVVLLKTALKEKNRGLVTGERGVRRAEDRALLNGFRAHVLDIDDAHGSVRGHPGSVILSALFSVAEKGDRGKDFLDAYIIGTEVMARLGEAVNPEHYQKGWHNTGTLGGIAAAAALSRYWHLDKETTAMAMGIAATRASGLRAQFGTSVKALHVGFAASAAVQAIELSCSGLSGQKDILFSPYGFLDVMADFDRKSEQERRERLGRSLEAPWGIKWKIADPGL
ncbi:MAG: MmgE/PrpD family protein [Clostridiales bacterium]|nr:MmgE/PrpD family protein [Clostridiales bacterium]